MRPSEDTAPTMSVLFSDLLDDAAIFPPGNAPMTVAVPAHATHVSAWYADMVGPFLCTGSRLPDLVDALDATPEVAALDVVVVVDRGLGSLHDAAVLVAEESRLVLTGVEIPLRGDLVAVEAERAVTAALGVLGGSDERSPVAVEIPFAPGWRRALEVVAEWEYRAKFRTGGESGDAHPSESDLAERIVACLDLDVRFKLTAGLHHAVRRTDPATGFEQHGFLNILLAADAARDGAGADEVARVLAIRDEETVAARVRDLGEGRARRVRQWFRSFGTCSVTEPVDDLVRLGLLEAAA